jgi:YVTN family beta-propeller protein
MAVTDGGLLFIGTDTPNSLYTVDLNNNFTLTTVTVPANFPPLNTISDPAPIHYNSASNTLFFIARSNSFEGGIIYYDLNTTTFTVIPQPSYNTFYTPAATIYQNKLVVTIQGQGQKLAGVHIIDCITKSILYSYTMPEPFTDYIGASRVIAYNNYLYVVGADNLLKISLDSASPSVTSVGIGRDATWIELVGTNVYTCNSTDRTVSVVNISTSTPTVTKTITVGTAPTRMTVSSHYIYVNSNVDATITQIDTTTNTIVNTITLSSPGRSITSVGTYIYVAIPMMQSVAQIGGSQSGGGPVPCFPAGTRILTASGYKAVETLTQGELVLTADGRQVPVKLYGKHLPVTTSVTAPYRVPRGTFGLQNDLVLSPDHAFLIRKGVWMIPKRAALLSDRVEQIGVGSPVTYYHLECPSSLRDNLVVDGAVVESYGGKGKSPYTYSESLKGYTRAAASSVKRALV